MPKNKQLPDTPSSISQLTSLSTIYCSVLHQGSLEMEQTSPSLKHLGREWSGKSKVEYMG